MMNPSRDLWGDFSGVRNLFLMHPSVKSHHKLILIQRKVF